MHKSTSAHIQSSGIGIATVVVFHLDLSRYDIRNLKKFFILSFDVSNKLGIMTMDLNTELTAMDENIQIFKLGKCWLMYLQPADCLIMHRQFLEAVKSILEDKVPLFERIAA